MIRSARNFGQVYEVTLTDGTVRWVPEDARNSDYAVLKEWVAAGGTVTQAGAPE